MNSIEETIERLNALEERLKNVEKEYQIKKTAIEREHQEWIKKTKEQIDREIEQKKDEIENKLNIRYNNIAQNTIMYYDSISFKEIDPSQIAELMISIFRRELDEIRRNI